MEGLGPLDFAQKKTKIPLPLAWYDASRNPATLDRQYFHHLDVSKNRGKTPKMDGLSIKMDDLGVPLFLETPNLEGGYTFQVMQDFWTISRYP